MSGPYRELLQANGLPLHQVSFGIKPGKSKFQICRERCRGVGHDRSPNVIDRFGRIGAGKRRGIGGAGARHGLRPEAPFSFDALTGKARELSQRLIRSRSSPMSPSWSGSISTPIKRSGSAPAWRSGSMAAAHTRSNCSTLAGISKSPRAFSSCSRKGSRSEVLYSPDLFTYGKSSFAKTLPPDAGFAGFRVSAGAQEAGLASFSRRVLFQLARRDRPIRSVLTRTCHRCRHAKPEEFPRFTSLLAGADGGQARPCGECAPRLAPHSGAFRMETFTKPEQ